VSNSYEVTREKVSEPRWRSLDMAVVKGEGSVRRWLGGSGAQEAVGAAAQWLAEGGWE
jgi:hypothetical protein